MGIANKQGFGIGGLAFTKGVQLTTIAGPHNGDGNRPMGRGVRFRSQGARAEVSVWVKALEACNRREACAARRSASRV